MFQIIQKLRSENEIKQAYPVKHNIKTKRDKIIADIISGRDSRLLAIVGPCSMDSEKFILEYAEKLLALQDKVKEKIFIVPRFYTSKPRSCKGFRGLIHSYNLVEEDFSKGIEISRKTLAKLANDYGLTGADELLYPDLHVYFDDIISYAAVGARSCENQFHRMFASGLDLPVGFKNPLNGNVDTMINSVSVAKSPNRFILDKCEVLTTGNPLAHSIFRGYVGVDGRSVCNADANSFKKYLSAQKEQSQPIRFLVDLSHDNSEKCYYKQPTVLETVTNNLKDADYKKYFMGFMCESYLLEGRNEQPQINGRSNTDGCLSFEQTEKMMLDFCEKI